MGHAQLQEKEAPEGFAGCLNESGNDRNSRRWRCHLQLSPGSSLNPQIFCLHGSMKSGETPCGRHGFPETWEEFWNSSVSYPKAKAVAGMGEIPTRHEPMQTELEEKQT